jgi:hypothetical protein
MLRRLGPELAVCYHATLSGLHPLENHGLMQHSAPIRTLRSTMVSAFLALGLIGCGNAQARAVQAEAVDSTMQDWETEPPLWVPKAIMIPRIMPPAADSLADSSRLDTTRLDSVSRDSAAAVDSGRSRRGTGMKPADSAIVGRTKPKRRLFNLTPADSARWPVPGPPPLPGSLLPDHRIVAFYGNPLSKRMGVLGELDADTMLARLERKATEWAAADSGQKVLPALHLIATVAQGYPGPARKYRLQMPDSIIERVAGWAESRGWLLILDIQPGLSSVEAELPYLVPFLKRPYVHLALDPEFAMKDGHLPGRDWMGNMDASEVNHAIDVLARIVEEQQLPPKVLVVHRFTYNMLKRPSLIKRDPRVQVVIDMDGYGSPGSKMGAYRWFVVRHPVQFTGFKLFFKNDKPMLTPEEVLELYPKPMYIQYQ